MSNEPARPPSVAALSEAHFGDLLAVIPLGIAAQENAYAGEQAVLVEPYLGVLGVEAQQQQLWICLAAFEPGSDVGIPQLVDDGGVVDSAQGAVHCCEQIVSLGREMQLRAMRGAGVAREIGVPGGEEPDGAAALLVLV